MERKIDTFLQIFFVLALVVVVLMFYLGRVVRTGAVNKGGESSYEAYVSAFQFEQEESKLRSRIRLLQSDYAQSLVVYRSELMNINDFGGYSELEKREKIRILEQVYSPDFFQKKLDLLDEENAKLTKLLTRKCQVFCVSSDLPGVSK